MSIRNLDHFFTPASVAVIGASGRPGSVGATVLANLVSAGFAGPVWPVNPRYRQLLGMDVFAEVSRLPQAPGLAVICTPAITVPRLIGELGAPLAAAHPRAELRWPAGARHRPERQHRAGGGAAGTPGVCRPVGGPDHRHTTAELFDAVGMLAHRLRPGAGRLAILTNGGGPGVMATDELAEARGNSRSWTRPRSNASARACRRTGRAAIRWISSAMPRSSATAMRCRCCSNPRRWTPCC